MILFDADKFKKKTTIKDASDLILYTLMAREHFKLSLYIEKCHRTMYEDCSLISARDDRLLDVCG